MVCNGLCGLGDSLLAACDEQRSLFALHGMHKTAHDEHLLLLFQDEPPQSKKDKKKKQQVLSPAQAAICAIRWLRV